MHSQQKYRYVVRTLNATVWAKKEDGPGLCQEKGEAGAQWARIAFLPGTQR